ncbi:MAG: DUF4381 domain-containing protein [Aliidiomarina sp.]|uniref:DUF4381 domain-containing protein n=1 Tax=Aliidiomarina sp. TaxID=1872439 RepID=UPI0025C7097A|nr:DUF4381 domain-containing protein [Aliidiomarina sp.]MCH8502523.1 DUF4381 domain-containing protein [Aliidiomarina sp.]
MAVKWIALVASPLDQLHDIQVTEPVTFLPMNWGWWVVLIVLVVILMQVLKIRRKRRQRQQLIKLAEAEITAASSLLEVHTAIRRACFIVWPRERIAQLHGQAWLDFWTATWPTAMQEDVAKDMAEIQAQLYIAAPAPELTQRYRALAMQWLQNSWATRIHGRGMRS